MELHHRYNLDQNPGSETVFDVAQRIAKKTLVLPLLKEDRFLCSFQHIFAGCYRAGYYCYKWAEVLSADAFDAFEAIGLDNDMEIRRMGLHFKNTILALGGGIHPMDNFIAFRGRAPSIEALLRHNNLGSNAASS